MSNEQMKKPLPPKMVVVKDDHGEWWEIRNDIIKDIAEALGELGSRRLEKRENVTRVVTLQRQWFDVPSRIITETINDIVEETQAPEGWEEGDLPISVKEARQIKVRAFLRETQRIRAIPEKALLKDSDLPKLMKDTLGDQNQFSLGSIITKLHFIFPMPCDKKEIIEDGKDGSRSEEE